MRKSCAGITSRRPCSIHHVEAVTECGVEGVKEVTQDGTHLKITTQGIHNIAPQIINILSQEGEISDISIREPNLDEIFLRLTGTALRD